MNMRAKVSGGMVRCGREITREELEAARKTAKLCSGLSRSELAETICEHWGWVTASGTGKVTACLRVLEELEREGEIQLPPRRKRPKTERVRGATHTKRTSPPDQELKGKLEDVSPVELEMVEGLGRTKLWNEYHHPEADLRKTAFQGLPGAALRGGLAGEG